MTEAIICASCRRLRVELCAITCCPVEVASKRPKTRLVNWHRCKRCSKAQSTQDEGAFAREPEDRMPRRRTKQVELTNALSRVEIVSNSTRDNSFHSVFILLCLPCCLHPAPFTFFDRLRVFVFRERRRQLHEFNVRLFQARLYR